MTKIEELRADRLKRLENLSKKDLIKRIMNATLFTETILLIKDIIPSFEVEALLATLESTHKALDADKK